MKKHDAHPPFNQYFICHFPPRNGYLSGLFFKLLYSGITLDKAQIESVKALPKNAIVVYATKRRTNFEYLFFHNRFQKIGLPVPEIGMDYHIYLWQRLPRIFKWLLFNLSFLQKHRKRPNPYETGFIKKALVSGKAGMVSLVGPKGFRRRFIQKKTDPLQFIIELNNETHRPVYFVPLTVVYGKGPQRVVPSLVDILFGPRERPGRLRRLHLLFQTPQEVVADIVAPISLNAFLENKQIEEQHITHQASELRHFLTHTINRSRQAVVGPRIKNREELKEEILASTFLRQFMEHHAAKKGVPRASIYRKAHNYISEIAADQSKWLIRTASAVLTSIINVMFDGFTVDREGLQHLKQSTQRGPLILMPCHKSHIDYLMLSYVMYHNNMAPPLIVAGKNLSFWPLGPIFRNCGAFFIRRTFRGAVLYARVFKEYIFKLLQEGFNIELFIEGTRSRTGKLLAPKLGFISILLESFKRGACEDLIFVPIYIGYDRVVEEKAYLQELEGGSKEDENIKQVFKARRFLKKRYGRIYIRFHEPFSLREMVHKTGYTIDEMPQREINKLCRAIGNRVITGISHTAVVTPHGIVAAALLNSTKKRISHQHIVNKVDTYLTHLRLQGATLADTLMMDHRQAVNHVIELYVYRKFIERIALAQDEDQGDQLYTVNENRRLNMEYYKNNSVAFFIPAAYTALSILETDSFQFSSSMIVEGVESLTQFFRYEFTIDEEDNALKKVKRNLKYFMTDDILQSHPTLPDTYKINPAGFRRLKRFARFLLTYFESYLVVISYFQRTRTPPRDNKDRLKKIDAMGRRMYKNEEVQRKEAMNKINYLNAVELFTQLGINEENANKKAEFHRNRIQRYLSIMEV